MLALDMQTGEELWNEKFADSSEGYYATGAPIVANGVLISGMSGGESTTRGFLDGWDPDTGTKLWRRYTIPEPGEPGSETWLQDSDAWMYGGGPTWRSGSYDPELDLVYWGTGNAEPYDPRPRGELDSLYTSSVLAIRPKTGELVCHFQYTPNDVYDVDGTDEHVLADMEIAGQSRKVMIQANKNGFLYVLDRTDCSLIAAHPYVHVNWATHIDLVTGRPVLTDLYERFLAGEEVEIWPSRGSNAVPIAFNPNTGLVYTSSWHVPRIQKIVVNIGLGEALTNGRAMESATGDLATITGQKPIITHARKSIAGFKIREGNPIGTCVTLRGTKMYHFLDRLINMSLPRIRDFRGIPRRGFDGRGNFSIGIREQIIFPEIDYNQIDRIRGLQVTITTTAHDDATATRMLELYGMPFVREV
mgnify:CR=1 FL=1